MQLDKVALLGLAAAREAVADAGFGFELSDAKKNSFRIIGLDPDRTGVFGGTGIGGIASLMAAQAFHCGNRPAKKLEALRSGLREMAETLDVRAEPGTANACLPMPMRFNPMTIAMSMPNSCSSSIGIKYGLTGHNLCCSTACAAGTERESGSGIAPSPPASAIPQSPEGPSTSATITGAPSGLSMQPERWYEFRR